MIPDNVGDRQVLVAVYNATGGSSWDASARANWLSDLPMAEWAGVTAQSGFVINLDLSNSNLTAGIPAQLGQLGRIRSINVRGNNLTGCIPYGTRLRNALFQSYNSGRGPGKVPAGTSSSCRPSTTCSSPRTAWRYPRPLRNP